MTDTDRRFRIRSFIAGCVLCMTLPDARADELDLAALTCAGDPSTAARWKQLERAGRPAGDGHFVVDGKFTFESVCVERVSVSASFGVLLVFGSVCDAKTEPLLAFVTSRYPELRPAKEALSQRPGVVAAYASSKRTFALYKGRVDETTPPDPKSPAVSFMCSYQASGTQ